MFPRRRSMKQPLLRDDGPRSVLPAEPFYGLDIETDTTVDGLDPARSAIVAVALSTADGDHVFLGPEHSILTDLESSLGQLPPGVIITWNGSAFDMPFLADRARRHDVDLSLRLRPDPTIVRRRDCLPGHRTAYRAVWGDHSHLDGYLLYRADVGRSLGLSCGLKALSRLVGLAPVEVDRSRIHELDAAAVSEYVASDARLARQLVLRRSPGHGDPPDRGAVPGRSARRAGSRRSRLIGSPAGSASHRVGPTHEGVPSHRRSTRRTVPVRRARAPTEPVGACGPPAVVRGSRRLPRSPHRHPGRGPRPGAHRVRPGRRIGLGGRHRAGARPSRCGGIVVRVRRARRVGRRRDVRRRLGQERPRSGSCGRGACRRPRRPGGTPAIPPLGPRG